MNELVQLRNDEAVCSSLEIAEKFRKRHADVLEKIEKILSDEPTENSVRCFKKSTYTDEQGKPRPVYFVNRDGFAFLVMGFTGKKASEWKWKYIEAFNKMESIIREKSTETWLTSRQTGMLTRKSETDVIKQLVEYAKAQGSTHSDMLYLTYTRLANKMAGVANRDTATTIQLNQLEMIERIILCVIREGMAAGLDYKQIYQNCKERLELVKELAYLGIATSEV